MAVRRAYEVMCIIDPRLDDAAIQQAVDRYVGVVTSRGGEATKVDHWGRRKFAYDIDHLNEGYYVVADLQAEPSAIAELDRFLHLADELARHKVVRPGKHRSSVLPRDVGGMSENTVTLVGNRTDHPELGF